MAGLFTDKTALCLRRVKNGLGMYSIGLTGGIGSGKSRVADLLAQWGAAVIDTDQLSHALTASGGAAIPALREAFGEQMLDESGALNRAAMRARVFGDPAERIRLEGILHPLITAEALRLGQQAQGCYVVYVVPLLVESGHWRERVDRVCLVDCDQPTQIARVQARSGLTPRTIQRIIATQASREQRQAVVDDVILNGGQTTLEQLAAAARCLHEDWCTLASKRLYSSTTT